MSPSIQVSADVTTNCLNIKCSKGGKPSHTRLHSILGKFSRACSHLISAETPSSERTKGKMWSSRSQASEADISIIKLKWGILTSDMIYRGKVPACPVFSVHYQARVSKQQREEEQGGKVGRGTLWGKQVIKMSSNTWSSWRDTGGVLRVFSGHRDA